MYITHVHIENYKSLRNRDVSLQPGINIIVGDNECGKSSFLEAVNIAVTGQLQGRALHNELHPHLFNTAVVSEYVTALREGKPTQPPHILIEVYFEDHDDLAPLSGTKNSRRIDSPGLAYLVELDPNYRKEYEQYILDPTRITTIPIEYYRCVWRNFADEWITSRRLPIKSVHIDATNIKHNFAASKYLSDLVKDYLQPDEMVALSIAYRVMRDRFLDEDAVKKLNTELGKERGFISDKALSVSLDTTSRAAWESGVIPHLDDIPLPLVGKGEQNSIKLKLSVDTARGNQILLIEEPENHLSHSNLAKLLNKLTTQAKGRQLLITTHNSFVLNKLGLDKLILFSQTDNTTLAALTPQTLNYFKKLPGYDTLRLILAKRSILVEGPSDELIVQRAYLDAHGKLPLDAGIEVISVSSLAFKRFLEIGKLLKNQIDVVTDNDNDLPALEKKYEDYAGVDHINIHYDTDTAYPTLEPQLLKANGLTTLNKALSTSFATDDELLTYMKNNKTDCALAIFDSQQQITFPAYITDAFK